MAIITNISKLSSLKVFSRLVDGMKTIIAYNKQNYALSINTIKGNKIASITETVTTESGKTNVIEIFFDNGTRYPIYVKNGTQGDKGKKGEIGDKGKKGGESIGTDYTRSSKFLTIVNDCETKDSSKVLSAYKGKEMADKLKDLREIFVTDAEYQLLWNDIVYINAEFTSTTENEKVKIFHNDNNDHTVYVKYWTYEDSDTATYYIKNALTNNYEAVVANLWSDIYLGKTSGYFEPTTNQLTDGNTLYYYDNLNETYNKVELVKRKDSENNEIYVGDKKLDYYSKELETYVHTEYNNTTKKYTYSLLGKELEIPVYTFDGSKYTLVEDNSTIDVNSTETYYDENREVIPSIANYLAVKSTRCFLKGSSAVNTHTHANIEAKSYYTELSYTKDDNGNYDFTKLPAAINTANFDEYIIVNYNIITNEYTFTRYYKKTLRKDSWYESKSVTFKNGTIDLFVEDTDRKYYTAKIESNTDTNGNVTFNTVYTEIVCPIWVDAIFTTNEEDELTKLINSDTELGEEDNTIADDTAEDTGEISETVLITNIETSEDTITLFNGEPNQLFVNIKPENATDKRLNIEYDDTVMTLYEDGRIASILNNCETEIKLSTLDGSNISKTVKVVLTTPMKKLTISSAKGTINENNEVSVTATISPENTSNTKINWVAINPNIVDITTDSTTHTATFKGLLPGNTTINAIADDNFGAKAEYKLEVIRPITSIKWNQNNIEHMKPILGTDEETGEIYYGEEYDFIVVLLGKDYLLSPSIEPTDATYKNITWTTSNKTIATVTSKVETIIDTPEVSHTATQEDIDDNKATEIGETVIDIPAVTHNETLYYLKGIKAGECDITGTTTDGTNKSIVVKVRVDQAVEKIDIKPEVLSINIGTNKKLTATIIPDTAVNATYIWKSSDENIATIDEDGIVTAIKSGPILITAESQDGSGVVGTCNVTVTKPVEDINISTSTTYVGIGNTIEVTAEFLPNEATVKNAVWSTSDPTIATVSNGKVTGVSCGRVTIIAAAADGSGVIGTCQIVVIKLVSNITFEFESVEMNINETLALLPVFEPIDATNEVVIWNTSDTAVATINNGGIVNALTSGTCDITATTTDGTNLSAKCTITVL